MIDSFESNSDFYQQALSLFKEAGHAITDVPIYFNHSIEQTIYFDTRATIALSTNQRSFLSCVTNISHLFDIDDDVFSKRNGIRICFYSMELLKIKSFRSQSAYDAHRILQNAFDGAASVLLFKNNDNVMLSFTGFASDIILSDWYSIEEDFDQLVDIIHIANMSLLSARNYFFDFMYCSARWYYTEPISGEYAAYSMLPINYLSSCDNYIDILRVDREEIKELVRAALRKAETEYGDDYIEQTSTPTSAVDVGFELDLLALEIGMDDEDDSDLLGDQFNDDDIEDDIYEENNEENRDEYEFDEVDPEIFEKPVLMVKWLKRNDIGQQ
jgi:hypothetical protein